MGGLAVSDDFGGDTLGVVRSNREGHTVGSTAILAGLALRVDADQFSLEVDERAAGVTVGDGGVSLNHGDVILALLIGRLHAVRVRHNAGGDRVGTAIGRAEGHHDLTRDQLRRISPGDGLQVKSGRVNLQDGQIGGFIAPHDLGGAHRTVVQTHLDDGGFPVRENHHVVIRQDVSFLVQNDAAAAAGSARPVRCHDANGRGKNLLRGLGDAGDSRRVADIGAHRPTRGARRGGTGRGGEGPDAATHEGREHGRGENNSAAVTLALLRRGGSYRSGRTIPVAVLRVRLRVAVLGGLVPGLLITLVIGLPVYALQRPCRVGGAVVAALRPSGVLSHGFVLLEVCPCVVRAHYLYLL